MIISSFYHAFVPGFKKLRLRFNILLLNVETDHVDFSLEATHYFTISKLYKLYNQRISLLRGCRHFYRVRSETSSRVTFCVKTVQGMFGPSQVACKWRNRFRNRIWFSRDRPMLFRRSPPIFCRSASLIGNIHITFALHWPDSRFRSRIINGRL